MHFSPTSKSYGGASSCLLSSESVMSLASASSFHVVSGSALLTSSNKNPSSLSASSPSECLSMATLWPNPRAAFNMSIHISKKWIYDVQGQHGNQCHSPMRTDIRGWVAWHQGKGPTSRDQSSIGLGETGTAAAKSHLLTLMHHLDSWALTSIPST